MCNTRGLKTVTFQRNSIDQTAADRWQRGGWYCTALRMRDVSFRPPCRPLLSAVSRQTAAPLDHNERLESNMRHTKFSEIEDHQLIECVKAHPELYNMQHGNNKNLYVKDRIWNSISTEVARDGK